MDELLNIIQNFGLPVGIMIYMITIGQKTLNDVVCNMQKMVESNAKLREDIKDMIRAMETASERETKTILEWMYQQTKDNNKK